ncbi:MAG: polyprenol monophosphomannose synthase [Planctomycetota bacterium]|nr:polyprenol monophosphomannose synthase [Planctomycetota bacterium]
MTQERLLVTLCTYNERDNVAALLPEIWKGAPWADILVVDDNSPDGTSDFVREWSERDPRVHLLHRPGKLGLGTATLAALKYAVDHDYTWVLNLDADFSHPPRYIPDLLALAPACDVAIGSRYVEGGGVVGWPWKRHLMSQAINLYSRVLLRLSTRDCSGAFRCFRVASLKRVDFSRFLSRGYAVEEELLFRLKNVGARFAETPFVYEERRHGSSKISLREGMLALWIIFRLGLLGG